MIDIKDIKYKETTRHGKLVKNKFYRHTCDNCSSDRGYQAKSFITKMCNKCSHKNISISEVTKEKMSIAAIERYNDLNWQPKIKRQKFEGQRRKTYTSNTSPTQRKLRHRMKSLLWQKLINRSVNKQGSTFDLLGYNASDLIKNLESKFQLGMTWENYGIGGWEIDHSMPDSWFVYSSTKDEAFKNSWALNNLQPMWASENRSKGARFASCRK